MGFLEANIEQITRALENYKRNAEKMNAQSRLGRRFLERTFDNFDRERFPKQYDLLKRYAEKFESNRGEGFILTGNPGTGKTHLAASVANYIIKAYEIPVRFVNYTEMIDDMKRAFNTDRNLVKELSEVPLLIVDDVGNQDTEWRNEVLYQIVNNRYESYSPMIITTNESITDLSEHIWEKTFSRLTEMCRIVRMVGEDYRQR